MYVCNLHFFRALFVKLIYLWFSGTADQIKYIVSVGCIPPMCDLLTVMDAKIVQVALSGLENILKYGEQESKETGSNPYAVQIEECYGLDKIEFLQSHENLDIYQKAFDIIEHYFGSEEDDPRLAPNVDSQGQQFEFTAGSHQPTGPEATFQFWTDNVQNTSLRIILLKNRAYTFSGYSTPKQYSVKIGEFFCHYQDFTWNQCGQTENGIFTILEEAMTFHLG